MAVKINISDPKTKRTFNKTIEENNFMGKKIGDKISGDSLDLQGYELEVTGGSNNAGFPMRKDMPGQARKKALLSRGPGVHIKVKGMLRRISIAGNTIGQQTAQINTKIIKYGSRPIEEILGKKEETASTTN